MQKRSNFRQKRLFFNITRKIKAAHYLCKKSFERYCSTYIQDGYYLIPNIILSNWVNGEWCAGIVLSNTRKYSLTLCIPNGMDLENEQHSVQAREVVCSGQICNKSKFKGSKKHKKSYCLCFYIFSFSKLSIIIFVILIFAFNMFSYLL